MFRYILALIILVSPTARAETQHPISEALASGGIVAALAELEGKDDPDSLFLQGSLSFLRGIEITMQMRWQHGANMAGTDIPVLRLPVAPNPDAAPFYPGLIRDIFDTTALEMERARGFLAQIPADADFGVTINITEIWFDVNADGMPQAGEYMPNIASAALDQRMNETAAPVLIRFDRADAYWLSAYTHVLSGLSEMAAAFDPTAAITQVIEARDAMNTLGPNPYNIGAMMMGGDFDYWMDYFTMVYQSLRQPPDPVHTQAAHAHFLAMVADNRAFWAAMALESDNEAEWIPNKNQVSGLGLPVPPETGQAWLGVLADFEAMLNGDKLIPYWRLGEGAGLNLHSMFMDPPAVDIVGWVQGFALLPYMERGALIDDTSWAAFDRMVQGNGLMFAAFLN
jgi:hypothetical protein